MSNNETILSATGTYGVRAETLLNSAEIRYMYASIDSTKTMRIDSARVGGPTISGRKLKRIFNDENQRDGYEVLKGTYGTSCYRKTSTPLFNSDFTKAVLWIDYQCGYKHGHGDIYVLEKRKGEWWLIEEVGTWES